VLRCHCLCKENTTAKLARPGHGPRPARTMSPPHCPPNSNPANQDPNHAPERVAYHGLVRAVVRVTQVSAGSADDLALLAAVNVDAGAGPQSSKGACGGVCSIQRMPPSVEGPPVRVCRAKAVEPMLLSRAACKSCVPVCVRTC
jgi:hypothetical protein